MFSLAFAAGWCCTSAFSWAQPPGTLPPASITAPSKGQNEASRTGNAATTPSPIEPKAFLMLDSAGNPVMVPGMTFEKLERLMRLEDGLERPGQPYTIESTTITGRVDSGYAELNVTIRIVLESTGKGWVAIPLRMGNFHRTGPADVSGVESYRMDLSEDGSGYLLHLQSETRRSVVVAMRVVVRVSAPPTAAIEFRLPDTVCDISLNVPDPAVSASIVGRGDEVLRTVNSGRSTDVKVETGGGTFSLRFGTQLPAIDNRPVLETVSKIAVDWQQADDSPLARVDIQVRNLRGDLPKVSLLVPATLQLLQQAKVLNEGPFEAMEAVDVEPVTRGPVAGQDAGKATQRVDVVPTKVRGDSQVGVSIDGQMQSEGGRAGGMVIVSSIAMENAVEQKGEIEVRTPREYRLRWTAHPFVHSVWGKADSDLLSSRVYRFRFDQVPFELPIWLSARARQLRVESNLRMVLYDSFASLRMTIKTSGSVPDARILPIDVGPWAVKSVFIADTTTPVEYDRSGDMIEIDLASLPNGGNEEGDRIEVVLVQSRVPGQTRMDVALPRIAGGASEDAIGTLPSTLTVVSQNDSRFVIDLPGSIGIGEVLRRGSAPAGSLQVAEDSVGENRYTLPDVAQPSQLVGYFVSERPSVSILADAEVSIIADRVVEVVDWTIYPQGGLRGRLPIAWGDPSNSNPMLTLDDQAVLTPDTNANLAATASATNSEQEVAKLVLSPIAPWSVVVDDSPAVVRMDADGTYQIYSDRLAGGPHRIRFRRERSLPLIPTATSMLGGVYLPRPALPDVTLREGAFVVRLRSSRQWELTSIGSDGRLVDEISMASILQKDLSLQLRPIEKRDDDVVIRKGVLRTAVGDSVIHEQFLATIKGEGTLRIGLSRPYGDVLARATVDGGSAVVLRDANNRCMIRLGEAGTHKVDLQVWVPRDSRSVADTIRPVLMLPIGIERLYWQLIVPQDQHLIWATATMGREMRWQLDQWKLNRVPRLGDAELIAWSDVKTDALMPPGNRYLLVGVDAGSLAATVMSRQAMWLIVGAIVLITASLLIYVPTFRHPMTAVGGAVSLGGLMLLLPDAAVIAGQLMLVAMLIVAVMSGVRHLLTTRRGDRILLPSREPVDHPTTRHLGPSHDERIDAFAPEFERTPGTPEAEVQT